MYLIGVEDCKNNERREIKMRWTVKPRPENGDIRVIEKFALLPVFVGHDARWLERVKVEQTFSKTYVNYESYDCECWSNTRFLEV